MSNTTNGSAPPSVEALRAKIAKHSQVPRAIYVAKAWGNARFELRGMSLGARSRLNRDGYGADGRIMADVYYPALLAECVFDPETGEKVFPQNDGGAFVNSLDPAEVDRICLRIVELSAMTEREDKELKNDSEPSRRSTSRIGSRRNSAGARSQSLRTPTPA
jgi:hypothetical protein